MRRAIATIAALVPTDLNGDPVVVTGTVVVPLTPAPPDGRTVVSWGHPTVGSAAHCAPSRAFDPSCGIEGLRMLLDRGYAVVATDYAGMGADGPDSYLIGVTDGNNVQADPTTTEPWATLLQQNSAGRNAFDAPLFVAQGRADELVGPSDTAAFVQHGASLGIDVTSYTVPFADHGTIAYLAVPKLDAWLDGQGIP